MEITILANGALSDVRPILALGKGLKGRGHSVRLLGRADLRSRIEPLGLELAPATQDVSAWMEEVTGQGLSEPAGFHRQSLALKPYFARLGLGLMGEAWQACQDASAVISGPWSDLYAASIAEKKGIRHLSAVVEPAWVATESGPSALGVPLPGRVSILNRLAGKRRLEPLRWSLMGDETNRFRQETLHLPPQTRRQSWQALLRMPVVQGFSSHVIPHPGDWPPTIHTTGFWFLDEYPGWQPPSDLLEFLAAGDPPVYVDLAVPPGGDPAGFARLVLEALERCGQRAILPTGRFGREAGQRAGTILVLDSAPLAWLLPCVSVVVHGGDAATTAECLRAGVPCVVVPRRAEQVFWARRAADLGVAPPPLPGFKLTVESLASAVETALTDGDIRKCAALLGAKIRAEDGVNAALDIIEAYLQAAN